MPRPRLPWFKVWVGATRHEKVATLDDRAFRAWVELLDAASQQAIRGRFASYAAAAAIVRRPVAVVRKVGQAGLLDERPDGVWLHDWSDWQRWADDEPANGTGTTPESHANNTGKTREPHRKDPDSRTESHVNNTSPRVRAGVDVDVDVEGDVDVEEDVPLRGGSPRAGRERIAKPDYLSGLIEAVHRRDPGVEIFGDRGRTQTLLRRNPDADLELVAEAYVAFHHGDWAGSSFLRQNGALWCAVEDVGGYVIWRRGHESNPDQETECSCDFRRENLVINRNSNPYCEMHGDVRDLELVSATHADN